MKTKIVLAVLGSVALGVFALAPLARAVVPAPDGGYPGFNTAEGQNALLSLDTTTGLANTGVGWFSLKSNVDTSFNTAVGAGTLVLNTADENTATGAGALLLNTTGGNNTANGAVALLNNTTGNSNTANGWGALYSNTTGFYNIANGDSALYNNIDGDNNIASGVGALLSNIAGSNNTATGGGALQNNTTGSNNIALGFNAGTNITTANNVICIGSAGSDASDTAWINNIYGVTTESGSTLPVLISNDGQLGTASSSRRFKEKIKPMDKASESILALKPVTFQYKRDQSKTPQFGLTAEEVAKVNPELVVRDRKGQIYTVRYDAVNAMLLNEFLKEHRKVEEQQLRITDLEANAAKQEVTISELTKDMGVLSAQLKEQAAQIQNVGARIEVSRPLTWVALSNP
jgi:uncharacterized coiled-coil protein SlyX